MLKAVTIPNNAIKNNVINDNGKKNGTKLVQNKQEMINKLIGFFWQKRYKNETKFRISMKYFM